MTSYDDYEFMCLTFVQIVFTFPYIIYILTCHNYRKNEHFNFTKQTFVLMIPYAKQVDSIYFTRKIAFLKSNVR